MRRIGAKGEGKFERISWDEALDTIAAAFDNAAKTIGAESVWPYHSGGTLGIVQRFGMERLSRLFGYSGMKGTICVTPGVSGWQAGVGAQEARTRSRSKPPTSLSSGAAIRFTRTST